MSKDCLIGSRTAKVLVKQRSRELVNRLKYCFSSRSLYTFYFFSNVNSMNSAASVKA